MSRTKSNTEVVASPSTVSSATINFNKMTNAELLNQAHTTFGDNAGEILHGLEESGLKGLKFRAALIGMIKNYGQEAPEVEVAPAAPAKKTKAAKSEEAPAKEAKVKAPKTPKAVELEEGAVMLVAGKDFEPKSPKLPKQLVVGAKFRMGKAKQVIEAIAADEKKGIRVKNEKGTEWFIRSTGNTHSFTFLRAQ